jgi:hypothetical protein
MRDEQFVDENVYFAAREEQLVDRLQRSGHTRRELLKRGAAGAFLLAGVGRLASPGRAGAEPASTSPIVKPLPPEWFINYGTNAEMRWDAVPQGLDADFVTGGVDYGAVRRRCLSRRRLGTRSWPMR